MAARFRGVCAGVVLGLLLLLPAGCDLLDQQRVSEESETHYQDGLVAMRLKDYEGAIRNFEDALRANPNSGSAHRELGHLYAEARTNYIRALYHYDRFRELHHNDTNPVVNDRVFNCKVRLAQDFASHLDRVHHQSEHLATIERLKQQLSQKDLQIADLNLRLSQPARATNDAPAAPAQMAASPSPQPALPPPASNQLTPLTRPPSPAGKQAVTVAAEASPERSPAVAGGRRIVYRVKAGDTLIRIANRHGVSLARIQAANPKLDHRRMKVGTEVIIPQ